MEKDKVKERLDNAVDEMYKGIVMLQGKGGEVFLECKVHQNGGINYIKVNIKSEKKY